MNEFRFRNKSLRVDLYSVQNQFTSGRLGLGSELGINKLRLRTKSLGADLI